MCEINCVFDGKRELYVLDLFKRFKRQYFTYKYDAVCMHVPIASEKTQAVCECEKES